MVYQVSLRNELNDAHEKLRTIESKIGALQQDLKGARAEPYVRT